MTAPRLRFDAAGRTFTLDDDGWRMRVGAEERPAVLAHVLEWLEGDLRDRAFSEYEAFCSDRCHAITMALAGGARFDPATLASLDELAESLAGMLDHLCAAAGWPRQSQGAPDAPDDAFERGLNAGGSDYVLNSVTGWSGGGGRMHLVDVVEQVPADERDRVTRCHLSALERLDEIARARAFELEVASEASPDSLLELRGALRSALRLARQLLEAGVDPPTALDRPLAAAS